MAREEDELQNKDNLDSRTTPETTEPGRRRFVKGAAAAAPVVLTVVSRPAMGGNFCTPSGFLSGNLSNTQDTPCNGRDPAYWQANFPQGYESAKFSSVFQGVWNDSYGTPWDAGTGLKKVLSMDAAADQYGFGKHATACYFNALFRDTLGYPMQVGDVVTIVSQIVANRMYWDATTSTQMTALDVVEFFKSTYY